MASSLTRRGAAIVGAAATNAALAETAEARAEPINAHEAHTREVADGLCLMDELLVNELLHEEDFLLVSMGADAGASSSTAEDFLTKRTLSAEEMAEAQNFTEKVTQQLVCVEDIMRRDDDALRNISTQAVSRDEIGLVGELAAAAVADPELRKSFMRSSTIQSVVRRHLSRGNSAHHEPLDKGVMRSIMLDISPGALVTVPNGSADESDKGLSEFARKLAVSVDGAIAGVRKLLGQLSRSFSRLKRKIEGRSAGNDASPERITKASRGEHRNLLQVTIAVAVVVLTLLVFRRLR